MKKILPFFALLLVALSGCEEVEDITPRSGHYVHYYEGEPGFMSIDIVAGEAQRIYLGRASSTEVTTSGRYPNYIYKFDKLKIKATYIDDRTFSAYYKGSAEIHPEGGGAAIIETPAEGVNVVFELVE